MGYRLIVPETEPERLIYGVESEQQRNQDRHMDSLFDEQEVTVAELLRRVQALEAMVFRNEQPGRTAKPLGVPEHLKAAWARWDAYRKVRKGWTADAKAVNLRRLSELSGGDSTLAQYIVEQAIERGWTGLYAPKPGESAKPAPAPSRIKTAREALSEGEGPLANAIGYAHQQYQLHGDRNRLEADIQSARERHSG